MHVAPWINTKRQEQLLLLDIFQQMFVPVCRHWPVGIMCTCPPATTLIGGSSERLPAWR